MEDDLSEDNILSGDEVEDLFSDDSPEEEDNTEGLFEEEDNEPSEDEDSESVGEEEDFEENPDEEEDSDVNGEHKASPDFYSSMAEALINDGVLPPLSQEDIDSIKTPEDFRALIEDYLDYQRDAKQARVEDALNAGVPVDQIKQLEGILDTLNNITEESLTDESDAGENVRKQIIYQDLVNRGYTREKALREIRKSFDAGTDIEDARDAYHSNVDFYNSQYNAIMQQRQQEQAEYQRMQEENAEMLRSAILDEDYFDGDININDRTRQEVYNNLMTPAYKDNETGQYVSELQRYQMENPEQFAKYAALFFTLTDGFTNMNNLNRIGSRADKNKNIRELEQKLNMSSQGFDGDARYVSGADDEISFDNWSLDE